MTGEPVTLVDCFEYVETDVPPGMTLAQYRESRSHAVAWRRQRRRNGHPSGMRPWTVWLASLHL
jgi:hypothetical protein